MTAGQNRRFIKKAVDGMVTAKQAKRHPRLAAMSARNASHHKGWLPGPAELGAPFDNGLRGSMKVGW